MEAQADDAGWGCPTCTLVNPVGVVVCGACGWKMSGDAGGAGGASKPLDGARTDARAAVEQIWSVQTLNVLLMLVGNAADNPGEPKFRGPVRKSNAKIRAAIVDVDGAAEVLRSAGFSEDIGCFILAEPDVTRLEGVRALLRVREKFLEGAGLSSSAGGYPNAGAPAPKPALISRQKPRFDENILREIQAEARHKSNLRGEYTALAAVSAPRKASSEPAAAASASSASGVLRLRVRLPLGGRMELAVDKTVLVAEFQALLRERTGIAQHQQRVRFGFPTRVLQAGGEDLASAGMHDGEVLVLEDLHDLFLGNLESGQFTIAELIGRLPEGDGGDDGTGELFLKAVSAFGIGLEDMNFWGAVRKQVRPLIAGEIRDASTSEGLRAGLIVLQRLFHNHDPRERLALILSCMPVPRDSWRGRGQRTQLNVERSNFLSSVAPQIINLDQRQLLSRVRVRYVGEQGLDEGGLTRDFFSSFATCLGNDETLLWRLTGRGALHPAMATAATRHPSGLRADVLYRACGRIFGMAVLHGCKLGRRLSRPFTRLLVGSPSQTLEGLQEDLNHDSGDAEPDFRGRREFLDHSLEESGLAGVLTFVRAVKGHPELGEVELMPGGAKIEVTDANKAEWLTRTLRAELVEAAQPAAAAFRAGVAEVFGGTGETCPLLCLLDADDLIELWGRGGVARTEVARWRAVAQVSPGVKEQAKWLWQVLEEDFDDELRGKVLQFATGSSCIGREGLRSFIVGPADGGDTHLPRAMTCGNMLQLPRYSCRAVLAQQLRTAAEATSSFEMM